VAVVFVMMILLVSETVAMVSEASSTAPIRVTLVMMIASAVVALGSEVAATRVVRMSPLVRPVKVVTVSLELLFPPLELWLVREAVSSVAMLLRHLERVLPGPLGGILATLLHLLDPSSVELRIQILGGGPLARLQALPLEVAGSVPGPGPDLRTLPQLLGNVRSLGPVPGDSTGTFLRLGVPALHWSLGVETRLLAHSFTLALTRNHFIGKIIKGVLSFFFPRLRI